MYFVYLLECEDGSLYTGVTTDVEKRFHDHKKGIGGHYIKAKRAKCILYTEQHLLRKKANAREAQIKKWSKEKQLSLAKLSRIQFDLDNFQKWHSPILQPSTAKRVKQSIASAKKKRARKSPRNR